MKYSGKQIRIKFLNGSLNVYRGSAYTMLINNYEDYSWVDVFVNGKQHANFSSEIIESVIEDSYSAETLK